MPSFSVRDEPDVLVITVDDPAALKDFRSNAFRDAFYETVQTSEAARVAVDLSKIDFLSSSGVAILVGLKKRVDAKQAKLVIFGLQPVVHDLLRVMRLTQYFTFAPDEAQALALLRPMPAV